MPSSHSFCAYLAVVFVRIIVEPSLDGGVLTNLYLPRPSIPTDIRSDSDFRHAFLLLKASVTGMKDMFNRTHKPDPEVDTDSSSQNWKRGVIHPIYEMWTEDQTKLAKLLFDYTHFNLHLTMFENDCPEIQVQGLGKGHKQNIPFKLYNDTLFYREHYVHKNEPGSPVWHDKYLTHICKLRDMYGNKTTEFVNLVLPNRGNELKTVLTKALVWRSRDLWPTATMFPSYEQWFFSQSVTRSPNCVVRCAAEVCCILPCLIFD